MTRFDFEWNQKLATIDAMSDFELHRVAEQQIPSGDLTTISDMLLRQEIEYARALLKKREGEAARQHREEQAARENKSLEVARDANKIAVDANTIANTANEIAGKAHDVAIVAALVSALSIIIAVIALFTKS